jgi:hypothetical protein
VKPDTQLHVFGSLQKELENHAEMPIWFDLDSPTLLLDVLRRFKVPLDKVQLAMVNHRAVSKDSMIQPGDRLSLFPREYMVFADWRDLRFY